MAQSTAQLECAAWEAGRGVTFVRTPTTMSEILHERMWRHEAARRAAVNFAVREACGGHGDLDWGLDRSLRFKTERLLVEAARELRYELQRMLWEGKQW